VAVLRQLRSAPGRGFGLVAAVASLHTRVLQYVQLVAARFTLGGKAVAVAGLAHAATLHAAFDPSFPGTGCGALMPRPIASGHHMPEQEAQAAAQPSGF